MTEFLAALMLGAYAASVALAPGAAVRLALSSPLVIAPVFWWTLLRPSRWIALFLGAALLLPPLPFALGDSGPHPALAVAALGVLLGLVHPQDWRIRADFLSFSLLLYFGILLASVALAAVYSGPRLAAASLARVLLFGISIYVFLWTRNWRGDAFRATRLLYAAAGAAALFACVDFYFQLPAPAGFGPQFVWLESGVYRRAQGLFYEASTLGNFCAFFLVMVAAALLRHRRESPVPRFALLLGGVLFSAALIFSFSRASLLNLFTATAALLYLRRGRIRLRRLAMAVSICGVAGAALSYAVFPRFAETYWLRVAASFEHLFSATGAILSGRLESWRLLMDFLAAHPWHAILGVGYKTLPYSDFTGQPVIADNMYLSMLVETGIAGLAALVVFNLAILRTGLRAARHTDRVTSFFGVWIFCFWIGQVLQMLSGDLLTYWRVLPVYFWALAIAARGTDDHPVPGPVQ